MNINLLLRPIAILLGSIVLIVLLVCLLFGGCHSKPEFASTYVSYKQTENGVVEDTLIIAADFSVERRCGYTVSGTPHFLQEHWQCDLDAARGCLVERRTGKVIGLTADGILVGKRPYARLPIRVTLSNFLEHL